MSNWAILFWVFVVVSIAVAAVLVIGARSDRQRRQALQALAAAQGWAYLKGGPGRDRVLAANVAESLPGPYMFRGGIRLRPLTRHVLTGRHRDHEIVVVGIYYDLGETAGTKPWFAVGVRDLPVRAPTTVIERIPPPVRGGHLDPYPGRAYGTREAGYTESCPDVHELGDDLVIASTDPQRARELVTQAHAGLARAGLAHLLYYGPLLLLWTVDSLAADVVLAHLDSLIDTLDSLPASVWGAQEGGDGVSPSEPGPDRIVPGTSSAAG